MQESPEAVLGKYQSQLFEYFAEFFERVTGTTAREFATSSNFAERVRNDADNLADRAFPAFQWFHTEVRQFYVDNGGSAFDASRLLGGHKLVLGGSSRFSGTHVAQIAPLSLYSDTLLIPDPVYPWLETDRDEERFKHVELLQAVHSILRVQPLIGVNVDSPPVVVFPSFEKTLEANDRVTQ